MSIREFRHQWTCAGCEETKELVTRVLESDIRKSVHPAPLIATAKMKTEQYAAAEHTRNGCRRPV